MSLLIEAEKLRRKLAKLEQKRLEATQALNDKFAQKRAMLITEAGPNVVVLLESADNLSEAAE